MIGNGINSGLMRPDTNIHDIAVMFVRSNLKIGLPTYCRQQIWRGLAREKGIIFLYSDFCTQEQNVIQGKVVEY